VAYNSLTLLLPPVAVYAAATQRDAVETSRVEEKWEGEEEEEKEEGEEDEEVQEVEKEEEVAVVAVVAVVAPRQVRMEAEAIAKE